MKKSILTISIVILCSMGFAQTADDYIEVAREVLKTEKKAAIMEAMVLTEAESSQFWELYNEFNFELSKVQNMRIKAIKDFADNFENMTDAKTDEIWKNVLTHQQQLLKVKKSYYGKFKKILPAGKAARYFQAENKIEALINARLALDIPLIEAK